MARPTVPSTGPNDVWGAMLNAAIFDISDRVDSSAPIDGNGKISLATLPAGSVVFSTSTTRPTGRTDIVVMFITVTDPGSNALDNDIWVTT